ncbi:hypothetical protein GCM10020000_16620 [Streptomyces olivoverticillatus]
MQGPARVGGDGVAVVEGGRIDGEGLVGGARTAKSASRPGAMAPLQPRLARAAGAVAVQRATSWRVCPRRRASVHSTGSPSWREEMPPQARPKSGTLRSVVQGEWSETTQSTVPAASPAHSASWLAASRMGGQHLNSVAPSGTSSAVRVRKCGQVSAVTGTPSAFAAAIAGRASADDRCRMWMRTSSRRASAMSASMASFSAVRGREARKPA